MCERYRDGWRIHSLLRPDLHDVYRFRRFEMMRYSSENGIFDFVDVQREQRTELAGEVNDCHARRLADPIDFAAR